MSLFCGSAGADDDDCEEEPDAAPLAALRGKTLEPCRLHDVNSTAAARTADKLIVVLFIVRISSFLALSLKMLAIAEL